MDTLYHGSSRVVSKPEYGYGRTDNDFGRGFYCTESPELAREWACKLETDGFANRYSLDRGKLRVLDLLDGSHSVL